MGKETLIERLLDRLWWKLTYWQMRRFNWTYGNVAGHFAQLQKDAETGYALEGTERYWQGGRQ